VFRTYRGDARLMVTLLAGGRPTIERQRRWQRSL
jgi:hypothetical protein